MDAIEWQRAGLYDPAAPNAADRLALLEYLAEQGCDLEEMVDAEARDRLFALAGDRILPPSRPRHHTGQRAVRHRIRGPDRLHAVVAVDADARAVVAAERLRGDGDGYGPRRRRTRGEVPRRRGHVRRAVRIHHRRDRVRAGQPPGGG